MWCPNSHSNITEEVVKTNEGERKNKEELGNDRGKSCPCTLWCDFMRADGSCVCRLMCSEVHNEPPVRGWMNHAHSSAAEWR